MQLVVLQGGHKPRGDLSSFISLTGRVPFKTLICHSLSDKARKWLLLTLTKSILLFFCLRTIGDRIGEGKASGNLGNTLKVLGRFDEAVVCCQRHLDISQEQGDKVTRTDMFKLVFSVNLFLLYCRYFTYLSLYIVTLKITYKRDVSFNTLTLW